MGIARWMYLRARGLRQGSARAKRVLSNSDRDSNSNSNSNLYRHGLNGYLAQQAPIFLSQAVSGCV